MKQRSNGIDYNWRPQRYWEEPANAVEAALQNVKGTNRRRMIRDFADAGALQELDPVLLQQDLAEGQRKGLEMIHPSFMGGEYLPDYLENEVEIARIELQSVTADVTSIRARPVADGRIRYRIVDEYESAFAFSPEESGQPLTLGELVDLIDGAQQNPDEGYYGPGLALCYNEANAEHTDAEELRHFTTVSSDLYDDLFVHYERVYDEWVEKVNGERGDDENDDADDVVSTLLEDDEELCRQLALNLAWEFHMKPKMEAAAEEERSKRDEPA